MFFDSKFHASLKCLLGIFLLRSTRKGIKFAKIKSKTKLENFSIIEKYTQISSASKLFSRK